MAVATIAMHGYPAQPEPELTPAVVIARAEAIAATLVDRQAEAEQRTYYAPDIHQEFSRAGFYRILVPRRYGGYEFGVDTFFRVAMALARGCPSTGWMYTLGAVHAIPVATLFGAAAQDEFFGSGEFICPATVAPAGTAQPAPDGGWILSGTWNYCSGAPYATHFMGHTLLPGAAGEPPAPMLFVAPSSDFTREDDWGRQLGLKGSGSHSITIRGARLPVHATLATHHSQVDVTGGSPGLDLHGNPEYGGGQLSFMVMEGAVLAVGIARGALDAYEDLMRSRTTLFPPIVGRAEDPDYQYWYGEAAGLIATAEAAVLNVIGQWQDTCREGPAAFTRERELRMAAICREVVALCWRAVQQFLFPTAGSSSVRHGERIERVWRDMSMLHTHAGFAVFLAGIGKRELARARFGVGGAAAA